MNKHWKRGLSVGLALALVLLAWLLWPDRRMAQAKTLQKDLFGPDAKSLSADQRREKWDQYRKLREKLSPAQRDALSAESRKRQIKEMSRYFAMSPAERTRHLDEQIKRMEKMRQSFQKNAGTKGNGNAGGQGRGGPPGAGAPGNRGGATAQKSGRNSTPEVRDQGRQRRLDSSTPAERAMFSQYFKDLSARRAQLGLPPQGRGAGPQRRSS